MKIAAVCSLLFISFQAQAQDGAKEILTKMITSVKSHQSISYTADYQLKEANGQTSNLNSMVHLLKDKTDTLWGGLIWMSEEAKNYTTYSFYDKSKTYTVMPPISKAFADRPVRNRMGLSIQYNALIWTDFLHPEAMERRYLGAKDMSLGSETIINGKSCYVVQLTPYYGATQNNETEVLYINKADHVPISIKNTTAMNGGEQVTQMTFTSYSFDNVTADKFSAKQLPANYKIDTRDRDMPKGVQVEPRIDRRQFPLPGRGR